MARPGGRPALRDGRETLPQVKPTTLHKSAAVPLPWGDTNIELGEAVTRHPYPRMNLPPALHPENRSSIASPIGAPGIPAGAMSSWPLRDMAPSPVPWYNGLAVDVPRTPPERTFRGLAMPDIMHKLRLVVSGMLMIASTAVGVRLLAKSLQVTCRWRDLEIPPLGRATGMVALLGVVYAIVFAFEFLGIRVVAEGGHPLMKGLMVMLVPAAFALSLGILAKMLRVSFRDATLVYLAMIPPSVAVGLLLMLLYAVSAMPAFSAVVPAAP